MWGSDCSKVCPCVNGGCDPNTGACSCPPGWLGSVCDTKCPPQTFGLDCAQKCECENGGECHHISGACQGWQSFHLSHNSSQQKLVRIIFFRSLNPPTHKIKLVSPELLHIWKKEMKWLVPSVYSGMAGSSLWWTMSARQTRLQVKF